MSELQLRERMLGELEFEPAVAAAHIGVVESGVATLSGYVGVMRKGAAL
jgi:hypothetical protein